VTLAAGRSDPRIRVLAETPLFASFSEPELVRLAATARSRAYREGEIIFQRDDPGNGLYVIQGGTVKITIEAPDGQETLLAILRTGECFGELAVLDGLARSASATAMERTDVLFVGRDEFLSFLDQHRDAMRKVVLILCQRLRDSSDHLADLVFHDVYGRLAKKLLELGEAHGRQKGGQIEISLPLTQQDLANLVGASRESVNKAIKFYRDKGVVSIANHRITVLRPDLLRQRVQLA
jgi:CRP/FNR family transcriptional regulator/CRP/FNR family cyclic AMP-dependent transcriptional regulator